MTRISKKASRRAICPKKLKKSFNIKTGAKKDNLPKGFKEHQNALKDNSAFIPKVK